ncbi:hypothetical protein PWT90_04853 [Aphanocladium album]|nr:hypothetical protein PWT90_04853 [Aphanocladium album]
MDQTLDEKTPQIGSVEAGAIQGRDANDQAVEELTVDTTLHGPRLWGLVAVLYLGLYLLALELTMLATVLPTLTNEFHTVSDISWYETAYVVTLFVPFTPPLLTSAPTNKFSLYRCVFIPLVGKFYETLPVKFVYLAFMLIFEAGLIICATAKSSSVFIVGRAVNGLGSSGQFSGTMLMLSSAVPANIRPVVTAAAVSMISVGSMTGPIIAGVLTAHAGWRWCFWMLVPMGAVIIIMLFLTRLPDSDEKPAIVTAIKALPFTVDPIGFVLFAGAIAMLLLALSWGGSQHPWSSPIIIGLLVGGAALLFLFGLWVWYRKDAALITPSCLAHRSIYVGGAVVFFQGGASQAVPFYLPLCFQAIRGDGPRNSAVHLLPSLVTMVVALITFGVLVRKFRYIPPWAIVGSLLSSIGAGLFTTLKPGATIGVWVGYQILTSVGRGISFQAMCEPITSVQEFVPMTQNAMCMSVVSLCMQLGIAVSVSASQTIFANRLPVLMHKYAPNVNVTMIQEAGASNARHVVSAEDFPGFLKGYNEAITSMFYFPMAACALAGVVSFALDWRKIGGKDDEKASE